MLSRAAILASGPQRIINRRASAIMTASTPAVSGPTTGLFSALRHRPFVWFTLGQTTSFFGDKLHDMALIGLVGATQGRSSALVLSGLALLYCLPFLLLAPIAGVLVDRWNRRQTLVWCDALRAGLVALVPTAATFGVLPVFVLVSAVFLLTMFFNVAKMAIIPGLVPREELHSANALSSLLSRLATLIGIVLGGVIVGWVAWGGLGLTGFAAGFYLDAITFIVSVMTLLRVPISCGEREDLVSRRNPVRLHVVALWKEHWQQTGEFAGTIRDHGTTGFVLISTALLGLVGGCMYVVVVVVMQTRTDWGTAGVGYVLGIMACGIIAGSAIVGVFGRRWPRRDVVVAGLVAIGALLIASGRPFTFPLHGPLSFAGGLALGPLMIAQDTLLHETVPDAMRGRVFAWRDVLLNVSFGLSAAATGAMVTLLEWLGAADPFRPILLVIGPMVVLMAIASAGMARRPETV
jgi:MFS family permease